MSIPKTSNLKVCLRLEIEEVGHSKERLIKVSIINEGEEGEIPSGTPPCVGSFHADGVYAAIGKAMTWLQQILTYSHRADQGGRIEVRVDDQVDYWKLAGFDRLDFPKTPELLGNTGGILRAFGVYEESPEPDQPDQNPTGENAATKSIVRRSLSDLGSLYRLAEGSNKVLGLGGIQE